MRTNSRGVRHTGIIHFLAVIVTCGMPHVVMASTFQESYANCQETYPPVHVNGGIKFYNSNTVTVTTSSGETKTLSPYCAQNPVTGEWELHVASCKFGYFVHDCAEGEICDPQQNACVAGTAPPKKTDCYTYYEDPQFIDAKVPHEGECWGGDPSYVTKDCPEGALTSTIIPCAQSVPGSVCVETIAWDESCNAGGCTDTYRQMAHCALCGNKTLDAGEQCDDGNGLSGDGCSATCQPEPQALKCGNGLVEPKKFEQCDDGNTKNGDGCSAHCIWEPMCGNGHVEHVLCVAGATSCKPYQEQCDDGNQINGDGCSKGCMYEPLKVSKPIIFTVTPPRAITVTPGMPVCGNGETEFGEQCDDGNLKNGDGCSGTCQLEAPNDCLTPGGCDDGGVVNH
ncbi:MAG: DUF4215 domain-containing protein [Deltaproteobacteria bacterium]|nr:DUF4215 domain-containing protein [Deltaproteobacteria bacterium]